jgi:hypothetical protein
MLVKLHFIFKIELSPAFWHGYQIWFFVVVILFSLLFHLTNRHLVPYIPLKMIFGMHFLRENEGSQKKNADSTVHLTARFHLTRKKWGYFMRRSWKSRSRPKLCHKVGLQNGQPSVSEQKKKKKFANKQIKKNFGAPDACRGVPMHPESC